MKWESEIVPSIMKLAKATTTKEVKLIYNECHLDEDEDPTSGM